MDELIIDGNVYVPSRRAAEITGYAKDYIGQLCREGRVEAKLVGRSWYVLETSLREHRFGPGESSVVSEEVVVPIGDAVPQSDATETWQRPSYTAEEMPEIVPLNRPNYLENTPYSETSDAAPPPVIPTVESAWEDWYAKSGRPEEPIFEDTEESEGPEPEEQAEPAPEVEMVEQESSAPLHVVSVGMDIAPVIGRSLVQEEIAQAPAYELRSTIQRSRGSSLRILKALFVSYMILVGVVVVIGAGFIEAIPKNIVTDFLAGITRLDSK